MFILLILGNEQQKNRGTPEIWPAAELSFALLPGNPETAKAPQVFEDVPAESVRRLVFSTELRHYDIPYERDPKQQDPS